MITPTTRTWWFWSLALGVPAVVASALAIVVADDASNTEHHGLPQIERVDPEFLPEVAPGDDFSGDVEVGAVAGGSGEEVEPDGDLRVADSGFTIFESEFGTVYSYAVLVENPTEADAEIVTVRIIFRDGDGTIARSEEQLVQTIGAGQTVALAAETPESIDAVEMEVRTETNTWREASDSIPTITASTPETETTEFDTLKTRAKLSSDSDADLTSIEVAAVYRNARGEIIGGTPGYLDFLPEGETAVATIESATVIPGVESTEVYPRAFAP